MKNPDSFPPLTVCKTIPFSHLYVSNGFGFVFLWEIKLLINKPMVGLPEGPRHLLAFVSLQSPHFQDLSSSQDLNLLLHRPLLWVCWFFKVLLFGTSSSSWSCQALVLLVQTIGVQKNEVQAGSSALLVSHNPLFTGEFGLRYFGLVQVVAKFTTGPCTSCRSQAAASTWKVESSVLDIHACTHPIIHHLLAFKLLFSTCDTP